MVEKVKENLPKGSSEVAEGMSRMSPVGEEKKEKNSIINSESKQIVVSDIPTDSLFTYFMGKKNRKAEGPIIVRKEVAFANIPMETNPDHHQQMEVSQVNSPTSCAALQQALNFTL